MTDYAEIAALHVRNGVAIRPYDGWSTIWVGNPAYEEQASDWPIGWILEAEGRGVVGWVGNIPSAYQFMKRRLLAATPSSWVVDAQYRGHAIIILKRFLRQKNVDLFICNGVSPASEPFARHLGFSPVPVGAWHKSSFWITNYPGFTQAALRMKSVPLARAISYPLSGALIGWGWCNDGWRGNRNSIAEIERCWEFDRRFDQFWDELQRQSETLLLAVRTRETLAWHFRNALLQRKVWILATHTGSRLTAYAIFDAQDNPEIGLKRVRLVDFQALRGSENALLSAVLWMLHRCREDGVHMLEVSGCWLNRPGLPRIVAPYRRTMASWSYYYRAPGPELQALLMDPKVWAPTSFEGDASL